MALTGFKRLHYSHYGAIVRDSTHNPFLDGLMAPRSVESSTLVHLTDPETSEELLIIGTSNMSTKLAHRTRVLAEKYKPNAVLVQAASHFPTYSQIDTNDAEEFQKEMLRRGYVGLQSHLTAKPLGLREGIFLYRKALMKFFIHSTFKLPSDWYKMFVPGLEMKYAVDVANKLGSQLAFAGETFDFQGMEMLRLEKNFNAIFPFLKYYLTYGGAWYSEINDLKKIFGDHKLKDLTENYFNKDQMAWFVRCANKMLPDQSQALIHKRSTDMFITIEKELTGKKKLAVVNQWHMEDLERLWRKNHGIEVKREATSGTEDLPLAEIQAYMRGIDADREHAEKITGTPMASESRQNVPYMDENRSHFG